MHMNNRIQLCAKMGLPNKMYKSNEILIKKYLKQTRNSKHIKNKQNAFKTERNDFKIKQIRTLKNQRLIKKKI